MFSFRCFLIADGGVLAQLPNALGDKGATATAPPVPLVPLHPIQDSRPSLKEIALTIDPSDQTVGERVQEFGNRKDVLKTVLIGKPGTSVSTLVEVKLPEGTLSKRPAHQVYLCLSLFLPTKGRAHLTVRRKERERTEFCIVVLSTKPTPSSLLLSTEAMVGSICKSALTQ